MEALWLAASELGSHQALGEGNTISIRKDWIILKYLLLSGGSQMGSIGTFASKNGGLACD
jgi:hypothetical protein